MTEGGVPRCVPAGDVHDSDSRGVLVEPCTDTHELVGLTSIDHVAWQAHELRCREKWRITVGCPGSDKQPVVEFCSTVTWNLEDEMARRSQGLETTLAPKQCCQSGGPVANICGLLESLGSGKCVHLGVKARKQSVWSSGQLRHDRVDEPLVLIRRCVTRTRTRGDPDLCSCAWTTRESFRGLFRAPADRCDALNGRDCGDRLAVGDDWAEVKTPIWFHDPHNRQSRKTFIEAHLDVDVAARRFRVAVETRLVAVDQPDFGDVGLERAGTLYVGDFRRLAKQLDRKSTRLNSSHTDISRMPSSA